MLGKGGGFSEGNPGEVEVPTVEIIEGIIRDLDELIEKQLIGDEARRTFTEGKAKLSAELTRLRNIDYHETQAAKRQ